MRFLCRRVAPAIVAVYCCLAGLAFAADTGSRLPPPVAAALANAGIPDSSVGIFVQDVQTAQAVVAVGEDRALNPASTIKLLTTFAALDQLGPAYQWATEIYADGTLTGDVLTATWCSKAMATRA
jgi:D-alanyl-D-alanine carboxypeptidase/D-alanyl-D-alanine-endopeptidase (penicillin-binding protein 4)